MVGFNYILIYIRCVIISIYKRFVILSSATALVLLIAYFIADSYFSNYKSEFLTTEAFYPATFLLTLINALTVALLSSTMLLNHFDVIRKNFAISFMTWVLIPMTWVMIILVKVDFDLVDFSRGIDSPAIFNLINTVPYVSALVFLFIKFRGLKTPAIIH